MSIGVATFRYNKDEYGDEYDERLGVRYKPDDFEYKKVNLLILSSCYSGALIQNWNMSLEFLFSKHDVGKVIGWDGKTKFASSLVLN